MSFPSVVIPCLPINAFRQDLFREITEPLFHDEFDNLDVLGLSETVDAVEALLLRRRIPRRIEQKQVAGGCQVESDAA